MAARQKMSKGKKGKGGLKDKAVTKKQVLEALDRRMGNVFLAAHDLECHRTTIYNHMRKDPEIDKAQRELRKNHADECKRIAIDNHQFRLLMGDGDATRYEIQKMDPKPLGVTIDPTKLSDKELAQLRFLLEKAKPDGADDTAI